MSVPPIAFTFDEAMRAADAWGFSCGPAAICALTGLTPEQVRPNLGDFRGWMTPTAMRMALAALGVRDASARGDRVLPKDHPRPWPAFGVAYVQWGGPWCGPSVPPRAAYRHTHWVASRFDQSGAHYVFDVNAMVVGGWIPLSMWAGQLVPNMLQDVKRADGTWWIRNSMEVSAR